MGDRARVFYRFGHIGDDFHGSQIQPDVTTVQGEFLKVFHKNKFTREEMPIQMASRTDAGVNVRVNGGIVDIEEKRWLGMQEKGFLKATRDRLPDSIALFDARRVADDWLPRHALNRTYRYRMEAMERWQEPNHETFTEWCSIFEGEHDWSNLSRKEEGKNYVRIVESCKPWYSGERLVGFEITGTAFVWNQVRRIASALLGLVSGKITAERVKIALHEPTVYDDLGLADSDWLILWNVSWPEIEDLQTDDPILDSPCGNLRRWRELARLEQKAILHRMWDQLGS